MIPITIVAIVMPSIENINDILLPYLSPIYPKNIPPTGRVINPTANTVRLNKICKYSETSGKKVRAMIGENTAYTVKS